MKMKKILFVALSLLLLLAFGCTHDTNNSSVTNPNPNTVYPVGYIQGKVVDSCTGDAIVGAVIDIGLAKATSNANGQYTMKNVPATSYVNDNEGSGWSGSYSASINMKNAYTMHRNADGTYTKVSGLKYADIYYEEVEVKFSSFNESEGGTETASNHDTPIMKLGNGDYDFYLGQLTASISGIVQLAADHSAAGSYTVALYSTGSGRDGNSATGFYGHRISAVATAADGSFSFTGVEAGQYFTIAAVDNATGIAKYMGYISQVSSGCDGTNTNVGYIYARSTDEICPFLLSVTPAFGTDVDGRVGAVSVVFTFSEPIPATGRNDGQGLTPSPFWPSLYDDVWVNYIGNKASNINHTLSWNEARTQLTVTIPSEAVAPGAVYTVAIMNNRFLADASGNLLSDKPDSDGYVPCTFDSDLFDGGNLYGTSFSTFGAIDAAAVTDLTIVNPTAPELVDFDTTFGLDWTPVLGAKSYHVYCQLIQWPGETTFPCDPAVVTGQAHPYVLVARTDGTGVQFSNAPMAGPDALMPNLNWQLLRNWTHIFASGAGDWYFVEDYGIKLAYNCYVRGVNLDSTEGPIPTAPLYIEDKVKPEMTDIPTLTCGSISTIEVCFNEPMNEAMVQNVANWTLNAAAFEGTAPTIQSVDLLTYQGSSPCAIIYLSSEATIVGDSTVDVLSTSVLQDVSGNVLNCDTETSSGCTVSSVCN